MRIRAQFIHDESGITRTEFSLLATLIAVLVITILTTLAKGAGAGHDWSTVCDTSHPAQLPAR